MFGLRTKVCPKCRRFNTYGPTDARGSDSPFVDPFKLWDEPTHCHACGAALDTPPQEKPDH